VHDLAIPTGLFEEQLQWLRGHCQLLPLEELLRTPAERLPERPVAITFDDGYLDNLTVAAPLLCRYGAPATFFVTSRWLDEPGEYWWDALERILLGGGSWHDSMPIEIAGALDLPVATPADRMAAHGRLHDVLVHASLADRDRIMAALLRWSGAAAAPSARRPMVAAEVREL
jgi:peptidoglycan/xylan/chitin deacetylase (PgdA/CDA1 family)